MNLWKDDDLPIDFNTVLYTNDPLHMLKRARYRFLSHNFSQVFSNGNIFNFSNIRHKFNIPSIVWYNGKITKMHDSLPLELFKIENLGILLNNFQKYKNEISYFLPFCLLNAALQIEHLTVDERIDYLQITAHYLKEYKQFLKNVDIKRKASQSKNPCLLFDNKLIDDMLSTILTINYVIQTFVGEVSLNRIGTNPLEHHFGLLRVGVKYHHYYENMVKSEKNIMLLHELESEFSESIVQKRKNTYGVDLKVEGISYGGVHFPNSDVAKSLLISCGILPNGQYMNSYIKECMDSFFRQVNKTIKNQKLIKRRFYLNSRMVTCGNLAG